MSARENFVSIEGNLVADPELRFTPSGVAVTTVTVATSERRLVDGSWVDGSTSYFDAAVWDRLAEQVTQSFHKGDRVVITGSLKQRSWEDKATGDKRYKVEIAADSVNASTRFATVTVHKSSFGGMEPDRVAAASGALVATNRSYVPTIVLEEEPF